MSNCPKCNEKLSPFYMKQNCPKCNTNLVYYDLENRLQADHEKAMKEQEAVDNVLNNIKTSAFGGGLQITRFVLMFSPLLWMCLPMYMIVNKSTLELTNISLIWLIKGIISGSLTFDTILSNNSYLFSILTMLIIILFSLPEIISSLFSLGEKAFKRNNIFHIINCSVCFIMGCLSVINGAKSAFGLIMVFATYVITGLLHKEVNKKLNK